MPSVQPRLYSSPRPPRPPNDPSFLHAPYDNNHNSSFNPPTSSSAMLAYLAQQNHWQNHPAANHYPSNPYPSPPPPPPIAHKVWILDCKSCGTFLTNRGMKVCRFLARTYRFSNIDLPYRPFCSYAQTFLYIPPTLFP